MEKVYMVCDSHDQITCDAECCFGRILREDGTEIGGHSSSSFNFLRNDLKYKLDDPSKYEIVDLIGQPVPERFKRR